MSIKIRRTDAPTTNYGDTVTLVSASLALRVQHTLLNKVLDGSATTSDLATLRETATIQAGEARGESRYDLLATARLASSLKGAHYTDGRWAHVDGVALKASRVFAGV